MKRPLFITFEGPEGSGKSTQIQLLAEALQKQGRKVLVTKEPGGVHALSGLRSQILGGSQAIAPIAELFLYEADRAQHVEEVIGPALKKGMIVLCDRFTDSTVVYQGAGRKLDTQMIDQLNSIATSRLIPTKTILLDIPAKAGLMRASKRNKNLDRLERSGLAFHERVRKGFLALSRKQPKRFDVVDAQQPIDQIHRQILSCVKPLFTQ